LVAPEDEDGTGAEKDVNETTETESHRVGNEPTGTVRRRRLLVHYERKEIETTTVTKALSLLEL
jgi:hypothetical protein